MRVIDSILSFEETLFYFFLTYKFVTPLCECLRDHDEISKLKLVAWTDCSCALSGWQKSTSESSNTLENQK